jgi:prefoldin subunit 5
MHLVKPTDQETIEWLQDQCFHLRSALDQTVRLLSEKYATLDEYEELIAQLEAKIEKLEKPMVQFKNVLNMKEST